MPNTENTFQTKSDAIALARCLSRNRDEDGDGQISLDEMKWYVPTSEQLMGMYLGANSLPSPLYDANNVSFVYADRANYHYATSDKNVYGPKKELLLAIIMLVMPMLRKALDAFVT